MLKVAIVGLGKMGLSHLAILNAHPEVEVVAICDSSSYVRGVLEKYTGIDASGDYRALLRDRELDAVLIATPSRSHAEMVRAALERDLHVFCEKPLTLRAEDSDELAQLARSRGVVTQVGYHNRFVGTFREVERLLGAGAIGRVTHALGEAYGPVVLKPKGGTWRSRKQEGGGSLYDYAAHPINLLGWYLGDPTGVGATILNPVFSRETDDEVFSTLFYANGTSARIAVNWSDESYRKMTTRVTAWGTAGRIEADRQECRVYLRDTAPIPPGYREGWNVRYTTELTPPVGFYLRGEEYSAQIEHFVERAVGGSIDAVNDFEAAAATDRVVSMMVADAETVAATAVPAEGAAPHRTRWSERLRRRRPKRPPIAVAGLAETREGPP